MRQKEQDISHTTRKYGSSVLTVQGVTRYNFGEWKSCVVSHALFPTCGRPRALGLIRTKFGNLQSSFFSISYSVFLVWQAYEAKVAEANAVAKGAEPVPSPAKRAKLGA